MSNATSLVVLLSAPRHFDPEDLERLLGAEVLHRRQYETSESFALRKGSHFLAIHNSRQPYFDAAPEEVSPDRRIRRALAGHTAWFSLDLFDFDGKREERKALSLLGPWLARLCLQDEVALYHPGSSTVHNWTADTRARLERENPLDWLAKSNLEPIIDIEDEDTEMNAAIAEAKRRWPEFVEAYQQQRAPSLFCVKARFEDGPHVEFMWATVTAMEAGVVEGRLDNAPLDVKNVRQGSIVRMPMADVVDWFYPRNGALEGAFTQYVLAARAGTQGR